MYVFFYRTRYTPCRYYYVIGESLVDVMKNNQAVSHLIYMGRDTVMSIGGNLNAIPIPKIFGEGVYAPISEFESDQFDAPDGWDNDVPTAGEQPESRALQDKYRGRKLDRYPGRAVEGEDEDGY